MLTPNTPDAAGASCAGQGHPGIEATFTTATSLAMVTAGAFVGSHNLVSANDEDERSRMGRYREWKGVGLNTGHLREGATMFRGNRFLAIEAELGDRAGFLVKVGLKVARWP